VERMVGVVPDDAFYYLSLARHFAASGVWTFDGGVSKTSGFHPFHAYACALVFRLWPHVSAATVLVVHAWIGVVATAIGLWCVIRTVRPASGEPAVLGVALVAVAPNFLQQATNVMEWHWVVLFTAICLLAIVEGR